MRQGRCAWALALAVGWVSGPGIATAQDSPTGDRARARVLFSEGVELADQGQWDLAVERFEEALANYPAPAVEYNLASAFYEMGHLGRATDRVDAVLADPATTPDIREHAVDLKEQIGNRAGSLHVRLGEERQPSDRVLIDGHPVPADRLGAPRPASPGSHVVALERGGETVHSEDVTVQRGETTVVELDAPLADAGVEGGPSVWADWRLWAIVTGAVVVTAVITALIVGGGGGDGTPVPGMRTPLTVQF